MQGLPAVVGLLTWKLEKPFVLWEGRGVVTVFQSTQMAVEGGVFGERLVSVSTQAWRISVLTIP